MKKIFFAITIIIWSFAAKAQVYDGITQPTFFRWWMPVTYNGGDVSASPFVGLRFNVNDWLNFTPVAQYHMNSQVFVPQLWVNVNHDGKYFLLQRFAYNTKSEKVFYTLSGTARLPEKFMVDFTWFNLAENLSINPGNRLQILAGRDFGLFVLNAGYAFHGKAGFVTNLRIRATNLSWLQFRYDTGIKAFQLSTAIHL